MSEREHPVPDEEREVPLDADTDTEPTVEDREAIELREQLAREMEFDGFEQGMEG